MSGYNIAIIANEYEERTYTAKNKDEVIKILKNYITLISNDQVEVHKK